MDRDKYIGLALEISPDTKFMVIKIHDEGKSYLTTVPLGAPPFLRALGLSGKGQGIAMLRSRGIAIRLEPVFNQEKERVGSLASFEAPMPPNGSPPTRKVFVDEEGVVTSSP